MGVPASQQRLASAGRELAGDNLNLSSFHFSPEPIAHILLRLLGGMHTLNVTVQRPGGNGFISLGVRGVPDDRDDPKWDTVLRDLYNKIVAKTGSGHVFSFMNKTNKLIEIEDIDTFIWGVDPTVRNLELQYVRKFDGAVAGTRVPPQNTFLSDAPVASACDVLDSPLAASRTGYHAVTGPFVNIFCVHVDTCILALVNFPRSPPAHINFLLCTIAPISSRRHTFVCTCTDRQQFSGVRVSLVKCQSTQRHHSHRRA